MRSSSRARFPGVAFGLVLLTLAAGACTVGKRAVGEPCLKDGDCTTESCVATVCAAPPVVFVPPALTGDDASDVSPPGDAEPSADAAPDARDDAAPATLDASDGADAPEDAGVTDADAGPSGDGASVLARLAPLASSAEEPSRLGASAP